MVVASRYLDMLAALGEIVCRACDEFQAPIHGEA
jgi:hypothetical protein